MKINIKIIWKKKKWKGNKKVHLFSKYSVSSFEIFSIGQLFHQCPMQGIGFTGYSEIDDVADGIAT